MLQITWLKINLFIKTYQANGTDFSVEPVDLPGI